MKFERLDIYSNTRVYVINTGNSIIWKPNIWQPNIWQKKPKIWHIFSSNIRLSNIRLEEGEKSLIFESLIFDNISDSHISVKHLATTPMPDRRVKRLPLCFPTECFTTSRQLWGCLGRWRALWEWGGWFRWGWPFVGVLRCEPTCSVGMLCSGYWALIAPQLSRIYLAPHLLITHDTDTWVNNLCFSEVGSHPDPISHYQYTAIAPMISRPMHLEHFDPNDLSKVTTECYIVPYC